MLAASPLIPKKSLAALKFPLLILLLSWLAFCLATSAYYATGGHDWQTALFIVFGITPHGLAKFAADTRKKWWPKLELKLLAHTARIDELSNKKLRFSIALAAGAGLYLELVLIRYHGTCFAIFGFCKNVSLLSCFLGLGIGYALGKTRLLLTPLVLPMLGVQLITMVLLRYADIANVMQNPISEQWTMGMGTATGILRMVIVYAFMLWTFSFNAVCLIPLGQLASRMMGRAPRLAAYSWNLLGSIASVLLFWGLSFLWTPPVVWIAAGILALIPFLRGSLGLTAIITAITLSLLGTSFQVDAYDIYSPYQILTVLSSGRMSVILVNHFFFQTILDLSPQGPDNNGRREIAAEYYGLPYAIRPAPDDVLIVFGGGNVSPPPSATAPGISRPPGLKDRSPAVLPLNPLAPSRITLRFRPRHAPHPGRPRVHPLHAEKIRSHHLRPPRFPHRAVRNVRRPTRQLHLHRPGFPAGPRPSQRQRRSLSLLRPDSG